MNEPSSNSKWNQCIDLFQLTIFIQKTFRSKIQRRRKYLTKLGICKEINSTAFNYNLPVRQTTRNWFGGELECPSEQKTSQFSRQTSFCGANWLAEDCKRAGFPMEKWLENCTYFLTLIQPFRAQFKKGEV